MKLADTPVRCENRRAVSRWKQNHPEAILDQHLRRAYGITRLEYEAMLVAQKNKCAICEKTPDKRRLAVDHDHSTGNVRALLCGNCNSALGKFQDSPHLLRKAADYLESHRLNKNTKQKEK